MEACLKQAKVLGLLIPLSVVQIGEVAQGGEVEYYSGHQFAIREARPFTTPETIPKTRIVFLHQRNNKQKNEMTKPEPSNLFARGSCL